MAANVLMPLLIPLSEQITNVTHLMGRDPVQFASPQYNITVSENRPPGPLIKLQAVTSSVNDPSVRYSLLDWKQRYWFDVQPVTGLVSLVAPLDRETTSHLTVPLVARTSQGTAAATLYVRVDDINEFPPRFGSDLQQTQITEEDDRHLPKPVIQVAARDRDGGRWGVLHYSISGDGIPDPSDLDVTNEGLNSIKQHHPHSARPPSLPTPKFKSQSSENVSFPSSLSSLALKRLPPSASRSKSSKISLISSQSQEPASSLTKSSTLESVPSSSSQSSLDSKGSGVLPLESDALVFMNGYKAAFRGSSLAIPPTAVAPPSVSQSQYWRQRTTAFSIDPVNGTIYVLKPLDRDAPTGQARWHLTVVATDGELSASTEVVVNLKDVNDNAPVFPRDVVMASVLENSAAGTVVADVSAYDADDPNEGSNARLVYSLQKNVIDESSGLPMFVVDRNTGTLRTAVCCLDREHTATYGLVLAVTDGGGLQGTCLVNVEIEDVNDVPPKFVKSRVTVSVAENRSALAGGLPLVTARSRPTNTLTGAVSPLATARSKTLNTSTAGTLSSSIKLSSYGMGSQEEPLTSSRGNTSANFITLLAVDDPDTTNVFAFRVVPESGRGWQLVEVSPGPGGGEVYARVPLDFEDPQHRGGLSFRVQVTDQGDQPWSSNPRVSECAVLVEVQDVNDNAPVFSPSTVDQSVLVPEDLPLFSYVASVGASDLDTGASGLVKYGISGASDPGGLLSIDGAGGVVLSRALDREVSPLQVVRVLAWDSGDPPLTGTATLTVSIQDVNDNPPFLVGGSTVRLPEGVDGAVPSGATVPFSITVDDPDDWSAGHGPPFGVAPHLGERAPFSVKFFPGRASASGGVIVPGELLTRQAVSGPLSVPVTLTDACTPPQQRELNLTLVPQSAQTMPSDVTVVKTATVITTGNPSSAPLGRLPPTLPHWGGGVGAHGTDNKGGPIRTPANTMGILSPSRDNFITFEDNFDSSSTSANSSKFNNNVSVKSSSAGRKLDALLDKSRTSVAWRGSSSGIELDSDSGQLQLDYTAGPGRHEAQLLLSASSGATLELTVRADVTKISGADALRATPLDLVVHAAEFISTVPGSSESPLDRLLSLLNQYLTANKSHKSKSSHPAPAETKPSHVMAVAVEAVPSRTGNRTRLWLLVLPVRDHDKHALEGIIFQHQTEIERTLATRVAGAGVTALGDCTSRRSVCACCCRDTTALGQHWLVVDAGTRSYTGPALRMESTCRCPGSSDSSTQQGHGGLAGLTSAVTAVRRPPCGVHVCLNGGKCVPAEAGKPKCVCPGNTFGPRCKILTRHFGAFGGSQERLAPESTLPSYVLLPPLPTCSKLHLTIYVLTKHNEGVLFSARSGMAEVERHFTLLLWEGRPKLSVRSSSASSLKTLTLQKKITDFLWHRLDVLWVNETVTLTLDHCLDTGLDPLASSSQTRTSLPLVPDQCRGSLFLPLRDGPIGWGSPLQLGGRHAPLRANTPMWSKLQSSGTDFVGCLSHLRVNRKLQDLGSLKTASSSIPGCRSLSCFMPSHSCHQNQRCVGSPGLERCECVTGSTGPQCQQDEPAVYFEQNSYLNVALAFTPPEYWVHIEFRFRTRSRHGTLVLLRSRHRTDGLSVELQAGSVCLTVVLDGRVHNTLCTSKKLADGAWHHVLAKRHSELLEVAVDHAESDLYASTTLSELQTLPFSISRHDGVWLGGIASPSGMTKNSLGGAKLPAGEAKIPAVNVGVSKRSLSVSETVRPLRRDFHRFHNKRSRNDYSFKFYTQDGFQINGSQRPVSKHLGVERFYKLGHFTNVSTRSRKRRNKAELIGEPLWKDFSQGCLSSVRVFGHLLPLTSSSNTSSSSSSATPGGTITTALHVSSGCTSPATCANITCAPPLTCGHGWGLNTCGCAAGSELAHDGSVCQDIDECHFNPCLNLGICINTQPGYRCECGPTHRGDNCQWAVATPLTSAYSAPLLVTAAAAAAVALFLAVFTLVACIFVKKKRREKSERRTSDSDGPDYRANVHARRASSSSAKDGLASLSELAELSLESCHTVPSPSCHVHIKSELGSEQIALGVRKEASVSVIENCLPEMSILGVDLVNFPPPTEVPSDVGDPGIPLPPPPQHFNPPNMSFGFDGGGSSVKSGHQQ